MTEERLKELILQLKSIEDEISATKFVASVETRQPYLNSAHKETIHLIGESQYFAECILSYVKDKS